MQPINKFLSTNAAVGILLVMVACKPQGGQDSLNTIENFSRDDLSRIKLNQCGSDTIVDRDKEELVNQIVSKALADADSKEALRKTLRSAPTEMLRMFHVDLSGSFVIDAAKAKICAASLSEAEQAFAGEGSAPISCWRAEDNGGPVIYLGAGRIADQDLSLAANVRHNAVRMLGYVYTQFIPAKLSLRIADIRAAQKSGSAATDAATLEQLLTSFQGALDSFLQNRTALKNALFVDLGRSPSQALSRLRAFSSSAGTKFDDFVFAEAFDSHYCSAQTRQGFLANNAATAKAFEKFAVSLGN